MVGKLLMAGFLLSLSSIAPGQERGPALPDYPAEKVAPETYVIHGPVAYPSVENQGFMNNPAFLITSVGVVVVDPGSTVQSGEMVLRQIRKITDKPVAAVLNTHVHGDHWLGNQALREAYPEVPIYGHPNMIVAIEAGAGANWVDNMKRMTAGASAGTRVVGPNHAVDDGDSVAFGGVEFRFHYAGKAHSDSDLMIEVPAVSVLFTGDNVNNKRIVRLDDGSFSGSIHAIDVALELPAKVVVPGHGRTGGRDLMLTYRSYLSELYESVAVQYAEGVSDFEMRPKVAKTLERFSDWFGFEEEMGKHISLAYLEIEAKAFE